MLAFGVLGRQCCAQENHVSAVAARRRWCWSYLASSAAGSWSLLPADGSSEAALDVRAGKDAMQVLIDQGDNTAEIVRVRPPLGMWPILFSKSVHLTLPSLY